MKKRVLLCTEFSGSATGYGVYAQELLPRLQKHFDIAELAVGLSDDNFLSSNKPWRVYPNIPSRQSALYEEYKSCIANEYGDYRFNDALLDFKPDYVLDFRDPWMMEFQSRSPFRDFYNWIISPAVDGEPQHREFIEIYNEADAVLTYSDYGARILLNQAPNIKFFKPAYCAASDIYRQFTPEEKRELRNAFSIPDDAIVFGTVMRNQPRKLFADLFECFAEISKKNDNIYLYCHTSFPDLGWNIPELLCDHGISHRVLFTYQCKKCYNITSTHFHDARKYCNKCGSSHNVICGTKNGLGVESMNNIYNLFDYYLQVSTNEGFGLPVVEAASAGLGTACTNYSSMEDFVHKIRSEPIEPVTFIREANTSRYLAVIDKIKLKSIIYTMGNCSKEELYKIGSTSRSLCKQNYSWDKNAEAWIDAINSIEPKNKWDSPPDRQNPDPMPNRKMKISEQADFLIHNVLKKPNLAGGYLWKRFIKDLTYASTITSTKGGYYYEDSEKDILKHIDFSFKDAYEHMCRLREVYNAFEKRRVGL